MILRAVACVYERMLPSMRLIVLGSFTRHLHGHSLPSRAHPARISPVSPAGNPQRGARDRTLVEKPYEKACDFPHSSPVSFPLVGVTDHVVYQS